jgi:hypothetical protein
VRLARRHAEHDRQIAVIELVPQAQLDNLALIGLQLLNGRADQPAQLGLSGVAAAIGWLTGPIGRRRRARRAQSAVAFVAGHRVKPRAQLAGISEAAELGHSGGESALQGTGSVDRIVQHPATVAVQGRGVFVVRISQPGRVACHDGRDNLAVIHGLGIS